MKYILSLFAILAILFVSGCALEPAELSEEYSESHGEAQQ
jgi:hypothetical protein